MALPVSLPPSSSTQEGIKGKKLYLIEYSVSARLGFEL